MEIDPENPVVKLCAEGITTEMAGNLSEAAALYTKAWEIRRDDFESCIAAHYLARVQASPEDILLWNQTSLDSAQAVGDARVDTFYPSLYLNMGKAHETLGHEDEARKYYRLANEKLDVLPGGRYTDIVKQGVANAMKRLP